MEFILKDKSLLHKLRTINSKHAWLNQSFEYYPKLTQNITDDFSNNIINLTSNETVGRRNLYNTLLKNSSFNKDLKEIARTTEDQGLDPMTALNFDKYLIDFYQLRSKI